MNATHTLLPGSVHSDVSHADPHDRRKTDTANHVRDDQDNLLPARGVLISVVLGGGLWAVLLAVGWLIFR